MSDSIHSSTLYRGIRQEDFRKISANGFGDPYNAYPHAMAWYKGCLYVGITRANLCMLKVSKITTNLKMWPVDCPEDLYELDMRAQIWRYDPTKNAWQEVFRSPWLTTESGENIPREMGYRGIAVFQGESDEEPALYLSTYASAKGPGPLILRTTDGENYTPVSQYGLIGLPITSIRSLIAFKDRLFTTPAGRAGGNPNMANLPLIYESRDPSKGSWQLVNEPGFGDEGNAGIFEMAVLGEFLYAGTANFQGYQLWRTRAEGNPPYVWEKVLTEGAYRGKLNQAVASLAPFKEALYVGSGIQHGGIDTANKVGPAGPELVRVYPDGHWELMVGQSRKTPVGWKQAFSGYDPGFDNVFNGYFWRMESHQGWLYLGTFNWSLMLRYANQENFPKWFQRITKNIGMEKLINYHAGFDLYRSHDGENWLPVSTDGFGNPYNYGVRTFVSSPLGLFVGTVNPFAPRVALEQEQGWHYQENPHGGLEIWLGEATPK